MSVVDVILLVIVMFAVDFSKMYWILSHSKREITSLMYGQAGILVMVSTLLTLVFYALIVDIVDFISNNVIRFLM